MGSVLSTIFSNNEKARARRGGLRLKPVGLGDLPENCLAMILNHFDPVEICNLARLNRAFYRASSADFLWEPKLPENYGVLVKKLLMLYEYDHQFCLNDIYGRLCRPIRISNGTKEVWCEKRTGGMCMLVSWEGMKITGIHDRRYWAHISTPQSRFHTIAYLKQIWWLEVEGDIEFDIPEGNYSLFFRLHLGKPLESQARLGSSNNHLVHGWTSHPVHFKFSTSNGRHAMSKYFLNDQGKWLCYHVGEFIVKDSFETTKIKFSMTQIDCTHQKGGLSLDSVLICPSNIETSAMV
uniref:F-box protein PP2-A13-like n=1 Tax=Erigeron canadensis TaxID=72917 RepID=UPI001CB9CCB4|nr:F-box protein PP2-A13-like [Erigeron canadensis]